VLVALAYWAVQFVVILRVWGSRRLFQMRGPASGYRTVRKYTTSLSGRPLAVSVAVFLAAVLNIVLSVTFGSEPGLRANAWGGYGMAIWITGMGIIWDAALLRQPAKLN
jgi:sterol desaturase/sphingolipid hydroxylase (fatty acid hydroxylase superfamily)